MIKSHYDDESDCSEDSIDQILNTEDDELASYRERRMEELKRQSLELSRMRENGHGEYFEATNDKEILNITTSTKRVLVHFYHKDFKRCQIMDHHLQQLARTHFETRFVRILVDKCPFLVDKLQIRVLPCVIGFIDGISVDKIIGFEEFGNKDNFTTDSLEKRLTKESVILLKSNTKKSIFDFGTDNINDDDDE
ncbi:thioredoxin-like protein [Rozella allomycis CSF55]|uniref:Thioredoxin-like fold domain-containing protein n=1 Tax=Rozella allomycis (strain CSF55) TaxID=988480 RepID=A0A075ATM0_ROZAC|nr:Thioredoxin-like fold domain-containing protein [Rozella allomycis CSF55]RKP21094.1 thioredoxin-like protein [Rozella allomycis CSF55]|eukprot:EPZ31902.1 Thioredoxin-like fold domain-containing protein [Rozella allomycis CSF55]